MLFEWQKDVAKYIPDPVLGYDFVCRIPVFIPIQEIGLTIWERKVQSLTFIHECIMTLVSCGAKTILEIADKFGVPEKVMLQIIAQLDSEQLVAISAGNIILTEKGNQALKTQKKVQILRKQFSRIFVNQITGEISDNSPVGTYREPPRNQVYLNEIYPISLEFLREKFDLLSAIYRESRIENTVFGSNSTTESELYRILDVSYNSLSYIRDYCSVYINQEDKSLSFKFHSGVQVYADAFQEQISKRMNGAWRLLAQPQKPTCPLTTLGSEGLPKDLIESLSSNEHLDQRLELVENAYYQDRYLLDGEIHDILCNSNAFKPEKILIEAPYLGDFLSDTTIASILAQSTKKLIVHYDLNDRAAPSIIKNLHEKTEGRKGFQLEVIEKAGINTIKLYFDDKCTIIGCYYPKETVYHRHIYKLSSYVSFDHLGNKRLWDDAIADKLDDATIEI